MITDRLRGNLNSGTSLDAQPDVYGPRGRIIRPGTPAPTTGLDQSPTGLTYANTSGKGPTPPVVPGPTGGATPTVATPPAPVSQTPTTPTQPTTPTLPAMPTLPRPTTPTTGSSAPYTPAGMDAGRMVTQNELVANQLNSLLNSNSSYVRNARQRGVEMAAGRGLVNSSMAAGAAQRAAIEAGLPIAQSDAQAYRSANDQTYAALTQLRQMRVAGDIQNWLGAESFNREWNGALAMLPIRSSMDMLTYTTQRAMEDPAVYTPDVLSGFNNFFNQNMFDIMGRYFGGGTTPGGG